MATFGGADGGSTDAQGQGAAGANAEAAQQTQDRINKSQNNEQVDEPQYGTNNPAPTAEDVGLDVGKVQADDKVGTVLSQVAAAEAGVGKTDGFTIYSSHPVQNFMVGVYQFENTILRLKDEMVADFEAMIDKLPAQDRLLIKKIDVGAAEDIIKTRNDLTATATRNFDSSVGRAAIEQLRQTAPLLGTQKIEEMNRPAAGFAAGAGNNPVIVETQTESGDRTEVSSESK